MTLFSHGLRAEIAQSIAGLIVHDLLPWQTAREKVAASYGRIPAGEMPSGEEIESAVRETWAIFDAKAHSALLRARRSAALRLLSTLLAPFEGFLTGPVLNGAATPESNITLLVYTEDVKAVEVELLKRDLAFDVLETIDPRMPPPLEVLAFLDPESPPREPVGVLVEIRSPRERGRRPERRTPDAWQEDWEAAGRLDAAALEKHLALKRHPHG